MTNVLAHRGPDDSAVYHSGAGRRFSSCEAPPDGLMASRKPGAALGFRRLAIIDLVTGQQPLANEDDTVWIAFNGEIYNYCELRPDLEKRGHRFRTHSDTETIVHLYEEYGPKCVERLRGMFALAIWDERRQRLFLARDRLGKKPLFYRLERDRLLFGSELKALLQFPGAPREVDPAALDAYLTYQYVPHPECILRGYHKLPPGHSAVYEKGQLQVERYWTPPFAEPNGSGAENGHSNHRGRSYDDWKQELRSTLTEAVRLRLRSDVPLGAFLSGGVDSTIISGLMQQLSSAADPHFLDRLSGEALRRDVVRAGGGRVPGHAAPRADRRAARPVDPSQADLALRRAVRRQLGDSHDVPFGDDPPRGDRRPLRRRRRRALLRL